MSNNEKLELKVTSVRQLTEEELGEVAGGTSGQYCTGGASSCYTMPIYGCAPTQRPCYSGSPYVCNK